MKSNPSHMALVCAQFGPLAFLKGLGVNFDYLPGKGEPEKLKKGEEVWCMGQVFLKRGRGTGTFPILFFQVFSF